MIGLPYGMAITIACVLLVARYLLDVEAAGKGKVLVGSATVASLVVPGGQPWSITPMLMQLAVCLFVLLRMRATE